MPELSSEMAKKVTQGGATQDIVEEYDKQYGTYDATKSDLVGKPTSAGPGMLPNTPSPFKLNSY